METPSLSPPPPPQTGKLQLIWSPIPTAISWWISFAAILPLGGQFRSALLSASVGSNGGETKFVLKVRWAVLDKGVMVWWHLHSHFFSSHCEHHQTDTRLLPAAGLSSHTGTSLPLLCLWYYRRRVRAAAKHHPHHIWNLHTEEGSVNGATISDNRKKSPNLMRKSHMWCPPDGDFIEIPPRKRYPFPWVRARLGPPFTDADNMM